MKKTLLLLALMLSILVQSSSSPLGASKMVAVVVVMDMGDDKEVIATIFTSLMAAQRISKILDIEVTLAGDVVSDDVMIFNIKSQQQKELTMKMFDEEGHELSAHRIFKIDQGNNYRALNVESLDDGTYLFELIDSKDEIIQRTVKIQRQDKNPQQ